MRGQRRCSQSCVWITSHICWCPEISLFDHLYLLRRLLIQRCGGGRIFPSLAMSHPKINFEFEVERSNNIVLLASIALLEKDPIIHSWGNSKAPEAHWNFPIMKTHHHLVFSACSRGLQEGLTRSPLYAGEEAERARSRGELGERLRAKPSLVSPGKSFLHWTMPGPLSYGGKGSLTEKVSLLLISSFCRCPSEPNFTLHLLSFCLSLLGLPFKKKKKIIDWEA